MRTVKIISISKRATERIKQHGEKFRLMTMDYYNGIDAIFVESLNETAAGKRKWFG